MTTSEPESPRNDIVRLIRPSLIMLLTALIVVMFGVGQIYIRGSEIKKAEVASTWVLSLNFPVYVSTGDQHTIQISVSNILTTTTEPLTVTIAYNGSLPLTSLPGKQTSVSFGELQPGERASREAVITIWETGGQMIQPSERVPFDVWISAPTGSRKVEALHYDAWLAPIHYLRKIYQFANAGFIALILFVGQKIILPFFLSAINAKSHPEAMSDMG